jgi:hypothetical protein
MPQYVKNKDFFSAMDMEICKALIYFDCAIYAPNSKKNKSFHLNFFQQPSLVYL